MVASIGSVPAPAQNIVNEQPVASEKKEDTAAKADTLVAVNTEAPVEAPVVKQAELTDVENKA